MLKSRDNTRRLLACAGLLLAFFAIAAALQVARGAMTSSFVAHHDEPAHVVTGLMMRDYLSNPEPLHPVRYAERYYTHYPKVGLGQWPPLFYLVQAAWTGIFGASRVSLMLLMSLITAAVATLVFFALRPRGGAAIALLGASFFLAMPMVIDLGGSVMTEIPVALLVLAAALCFARYLETESARWSVAFGFLAAGAILTKGNGLALMFLPPLAMALHRRKWHLLRRWSLWAPALVVALCCAPWYAFTVGMVKNNWAGSFGIPYIRNALAHYLPWMLSMTGIGVLLVALGGVLLPRAREDRPFWACIVALPVSVLLLHTLIPSSIEERHLAVAAPAIAILFALGVGVIGRNNPRLTVAVALLGGLLFAVEAAKLPPKEVLGYEGAVGDLLEDPALYGGVFLIASDSKGEGAFVSEVALADTRFGHFVLRGSKVLAREGWYGREYESVYKTEEELLGFLRKVPVAIVVIDEGMNPRFNRGYHDMLRDLVRKRPALFKPRGTYATVRRHESYPKGLLVYEVAGHIDRHRARIDFAIATGAKPPR